MAFDQQDYWTGTGYSQTPDRASQNTEGYRPFDESLAMGRDFSTPEFQNAPWAGGPTQDLDYGEINPWEGGTAPEGSTGYNWGRDLYTLTPGVGAFGMKKKKRGSTEFSAPGYQGYQFEPEEGFPSYYETAQNAQGAGGGGFEEGATNFQYQQPDQQGYDYNYSGGVAQPGSGQLANPSQQNYVGQQEQEYGSFYNRDKGGIYDTFTL